ncbi:hypothetical protein N657DRAFT_714948, partial [Parathielavia appendiculata]
PRPSLGPSGSQQTSNFARSHHDPAHSLPLPAYSFLLLVHLASASTLLITVVASPLATSRSVCTSVDLFHDIFLGATSCHPSSAGVKPQSDNELDLTICIVMNQITGHMQWMGYGKFSDCCTHCTISQPMGEAKAVAYLLV